MSELDPRPAAAVAELARRGRITERQVLDLAGKWKHGWVPLDATALAIKMKRKPGSGSGSSRRPAGKGRGNIAGTLAASGRKESLGRRKSVGRGKGDPVVKPSGLEGSSLHQTPAQRTARAEAMFGTGSKQHRTAQEMEKRDNAKAAADAKRRAGDAEGAARSAARVNAATATPKQGPDLSGHSATTLHSMAQGASPETKARVAAELRSRGIDPAAVQQKRNARARERQGAEDWTVFAAQHRGKAPSEIRGELEKLSTARLERMADGLAKDNPRLATAIRSILSIRKERG